MGSQQQNSTTAPKKRDSWQTPQWLFDYADSLFVFDFDLAASESNHKCERYFDIEDNALTQSWFRAGNTLYCNPPYSNIKPWLEKAWETAQTGREVVILCPTPNGESSYRDHVFGKASEIIFINGRVAFELPNDDGTTTPIAGNTRGSCLIIYNRRYEGQTALSWIDRDEVKGDFEERGL